MIEESPSTKKQQSSRNLWCRQVAECLNEKGVEKREVIDRLTTRGLDMLWTGDSFKEDIFKPIFQKVSGAESTQDGNTTDDNVVYMGLCRWIAEEWEVTLPAWPTRFAEGENN